MYLCTTTIAHYSNIPFARCNIFFDMQIPTLTDMHITECVCVCTPQQFNCTNTHANRYWFERQICNWVISYSFCLCVYCILFSWLLAFHLLLLQQHSLILLLPAFMADARLYDSMKQCDEKPNRTLYNLNFKLTVCFGVSTKYVQQ